MLKWTTNSLRRRFPIYPYGRRCNFSRLSENFYGEEKSCGMRKKKKFFLLHSTIFPFPIALIVSLIAWSFTPIKHETKLSLCTIELEESSALITFRLFTDDLAEVISAPLLDNPSDKQYDQKVVAYLQTHFAIHINGKQQELFFFSRSANEEVFEVSFLLSNLSQIDELEIHNRIFLESFTKQKNLVKLQKGEIEKRYFFDNEKKILKIRKPDLTK